MSKPMIHKWHNYNWCKCPDYLWLSAIFLNSLRAHFTLPYKLSHGIISGSK